ncbi:lysophospholipid acyltransferase family protein [Saccharicrinis fermentans]|uniref:Lipid A biosynthesis lauroyl acyltransferase n=1 Tax=Saccharicrinis fermentans DSM 9555 = JCM 21142 TaxID=869213 RepID=W7YB37_9BACT|nr:lysophospholipid acyltransferase family protein [Saccharicrinis fermentans]GAF05627.1 lipid A biosynthesis lauroyl acyltransferase [Saccharicrinis fermentans DSM 9555 = JCM 21142]
MGVKIGLLFIKLIGHLPLWGLFIISDCFYFLIRISGYRRKVVMNNLRNSFPEKSEHELKRIATKFFHHLCDLFFETFKLVSMTEAQMKEHVQVENLELLDEYFDQGKDVIAVLGHYGNWEWIPSINLFIKAQGCEIYHVLRSEAYDKFMLGLRSKWGTLNFSMKTSYRSVYKLRMQNKRFVIGVISDQTPARNKIQYFSDFLNQDTPLHLGAEKMAVKLDCPVVFFRFDKIKRGYYKLKVEPLVENPRETKEYEITNLHTKHLENIIKEKPEFWLWSHKRWKRKREDVFKLK